MRVAIAGAGNVGQAIARSLVAAGHRVLLIERQRQHFRPDRVAEADWMFADACEISVLQRAGIQTADVVVAATGDDQANLVFAMLCKQEFAVARVVARVNDPANLPLFNRSWGVDVAVSTPGSITSAVEEVVSTGDVVPLISLQHGQATIIEVRLPAAAGPVGRPLADLELPGDAALLAVTRGGALLAPAPDLVLGPGDELVLLTTPAAQDSVREVLLGSRGPGR